MGWYSVADRSVVGNSGSTYTGGPFKGLIHTTEGTSASGAIGAFRANNSWPHFLVDNVGKVWQFLDTNVAARALRNLSGGVQTNRDSVIQIEVTGFAAKPNEHAALQMDSLRDLMRWIENTKGVKPKGPGRAFATAYGQKSLRFTNTEWDAFDGWCGHCHVPENDHWDPGAINLVSLLPIPPPVPSPPSPAPPAPPAPPSPLVKPMYDPPLIIPGGIAAHLRSPNGGIWLASPQGHIYGLEGAIYYGGSAGQPYFEGQSVAKLMPFGTGYTIVASENRHYDYAPDAPRPSNFVTPQYDPPISIIGGIAASLKAPNGGVWLVGYNGHIYSLDGAIYYGGPGGEPYFVDRYAARLELFGQGYTVVATSNETYSYS